MLNPSEDLIIISDCSIELQHEKAASRLLLPSVDTEHVEKEVYSRLSQTHRLHIGGDRGTNQTHKYNID